MDVLGEFRNGGHLLRRWTRVLLRDPRFRGLRRVLFAAIALQLALAPISSWAFDTTALFLGSENLLLHGNPYLATGLPTPLLDPPLGVATAAPGLALLSLAVPFPSMLWTLPPHAAAVAATGGEVPAVVPIPAALLAEKLPAVAAGALVAILLYAVLRGRMGERSSLLAAAAVQLNPDALWSSVLAGHFDAVAALFVAAALVALARGRSFSAGMLLGLGTSVKLYPILLVPVFLSWEVRTPRADGPADRSGPLHVRLARLGAGVGIGLIPVWALFPALWDLYITQGRLGSQPFGGLSPWSLAWPGVARGIGLGAAPYGLPSPAVEFAPLLVALAFAVAFAVLDRTGIGRGDRALPVLGLLSAGVVAAALLSYRTPVPENLLALLPLLLLGLPLMRAWGWVGFWAVSTAGATVAFSQLTPLACFYPLAGLIGPGAIGWVDGVVLAYLHHGTGWGSRLGILTLEALAGAAVIAAVGVGAFATAMRTWRVGCRVGAPVA